MQNICKHFHPKPQNDRLLGPLSLERDAQMPGQAAAASSKMTYATKVLQVRSVGDNHASAHRTTVQSNNVVPSHMCV